jgi:hypothetical protein
LAKYLSSSSNAAPRLALLRTISLGSFTQNHSGENKISCSATPFSSAPADFPDNLRLRMRRSLIPLVDADPQLHELLRFARGFWRPHAFDPVPTEDYRNTRNRKKPAESFSWSAPLPRVFRVFPSNKINDLRVSHLSSDRIATLLNHGVGLARFAHPRRRRRPK